MFDKKKKLAAANILILGLGGLDIILPNAYCFRNGVAVGNTHIQSNERVIVICYSPL